MASKDHPTAIVVFPPETVQKPARKNRLRCDRLYPRWITTSSSFISFLTKAAFPMLLPNLKMVDANFSFL